MRTRGTRQENRDGGVERTENGKGKEKKSRGNRIEGRCVLVYLNVRSISVYEKNYAVGGFARKSRDPWTLLSPWPEETISNRSINESSPRSREVGGQEAPRSAGERGNAINRSLRDGWENRRARSSTRDSKIERVWTKREIEREKKKWYIVQYIHIYIREKFYIYIYGGHTMSTYFLTRVASLGYLWINCKVLQLIDVCT